MFQNETQKPRTAALRGLLLPTLNADAQNIPETKAAMRDLLPKAEAPAPLPETVSASVEKTPLLKPSAARKSLSPSILALVQSLTIELKEKAATVLTLNPSRRDALSLHLDRLSGNTSSNRMPLQSWIMKSKSPAEENALQSYFEEVALMTLAQAILLKRWSDKGLRPFKAENLSKLNFELSQALKPHVPLHREGFHLTRPNLYSWFSPSAALQGELAQVLESFNFASESPQYLMDLCRESRRFAPESPEMTGYDSRFYSEVWRWLAGLDAAEKKLAEPKKTFSSFGTERRRAFYTPTLRFGEIAHLSPANVQWIGFEENPFQLLIAEMVEIWNGPKAPPTWALGNSLEAHPKEQMALIAPGVKPGLLQMLSDMEACEFGWILEERTLKASKLKSQIDQLPFFKKLKGPNTGLGTLQACVAITKIRPGGKLLWARETPITSDEGQDALSFILGRAKLVGECDLSGLDHALPTRCPLFPRYIYLFEREYKNEERMDHRPARICVQGAIKSHIELPLLLEDILTSLQRTNDTKSTRSNWKIHAHLSPNPQRDWSVRWPDPACVRSLETLEKLAISSIPLAHFATVRTLSKTSVTKNSLSTQCGLLIEVLESPRRLKATPFERLQNQEEWTGIAVVFPDQRTRESIRHYLESARTTSWLDHQAERKNEKWVLTDSLLRILPIPQDIQTILASLVPGGTMTAEWQKAVTELAKNASAEWYKTESWKRFIALSDAFSQTEKSRTKMAPMLAGDGKIEWSKVIEIFNHSELVSLTQHELSRVEGRLPLHAPILTLEKLKAPQAGLLCMTENGSMLKVYFENRMLADMAWDQVKGLKHPTWTEIVGLVKLPRSLAVAESAAHDMLRSVESLDRRLKSIRDEMEKLTRI